MITLKKISIFISLAAAFFLVGSGNIVAAADAETPANEGVCDILQGGTPGLYGLCVAYCEAQDLDSVNKGKTPSVKILDNYNRKKLDTDPPMPCVQVPCPCYDDADLVMGAAACTRTSGSIEIREMSPVLNVSSADTNNNSCLHIDLNTMIIKGFSVTESEAQSCYDLVDQACVTQGQ